MVPFEETSPSLHVEEIAIVSLHNGLMISAISYGSCNVPGCDCWLFCPAYDGALVCQRNGCGHSWQNHT
ncbi:hypothetical protein BH11VER1_BH11VER1_07160 [soil metagenome]